MFDNSAVTLEFLIDTVVLDTFAIDLFQSKALSILSLEYVLG